MGDQDCYENSSQNLEKFQRQQLRKTVKIKKYTFFTDGSANSRKDSPDHGLGGIGVYRTEPHLKMISKGYSNTTIGRMEPMALLVAINTVETDIPTKITVYSDAKYVVDSINKGWARNWEKQNWLGRKNADIWKKILEALDARPYMKMTISHIHSHQKDLNNPLVFGNSIADELCSYEQFKTYTVDNI
jgi:ribonuclease HI